MATMSVSRLGRFGLGTGDLSRTTEFYRDRWGLEVVDEGGGQMFLRGEGPAHHILTLDANQPAGLSFVAFEVDRADDVDRIAEQVVAHGGTIVQQPGPADEPGVKRSVRFRDPFGLPLEVYAGIDQLTEGYGFREVKPQKLNHVLVHTPDVNATHDWFKKALGFRTTDSIGDILIFMHCNPNHHTVALAPGPPGKLNHCAFEVRDWLDIARGLKYLGDNGHDRMWGPGRHPVGNNLYSYWADPEGNYIEYTAEVEQLDVDTWQPRCWALTPESVSYWGGMVPPEMLGGPPPGGEGGPPH